MELKGIEGLEAGHVEDAYLAAFEAFLVPQRKAQQRAAAQPVLELA